MRELPTTDHAVEASADSHAGTWLQFTATRSPALRSALIGHYLPLAKSIAIRLYRSHRQQGVPFADYLQNARLGLLEAVDRFEPARGVLFELFAFHRIRGAVLNGLRRETELLAQRFALRRMGSERVESLVVSIGNEPAHATLEQLAELTLSLAVGALVALEGTVDESIDANPYSSTEMRQLLQLARSAVEQLPPRERELIKAHYYEQREFRELAQQWSLSKGRISQLHARAVGRLQKMLVARPRLNRRL